MDLVNPRVAIGHSSINRLHAIIIFQDNGTDKIIDYDKNLIMKKDDYYELFDYKEINTIDKYDLYNRAAYKPIVDMKIFDTVVVLRDDKSFYTERMSKWT